MGTPYGPPSRGTAALVPAGGAGARARKRRTAATVDGKRYWRATDRQPPIAAERLRTAAAARPRGGGAGPAGWACRRGLAGGSGPNTPDEVLPRPLAAPAGPSRVTRDTGTRAPRAPLSHRVRHQPARVRRRRGPVVGLPAAGRAVRRGRLLSWCGGGVGIVTAGAGTPDPGGRGGAHAPMPVRGFSTPTPTDPARTAAHRLQLRDLGHRWPRARSGPPGATRARPPHTPPPPPRPPRHTTPPRMPAAGPAGRRLATPLRP